jgi:hypothetical protein
VQLLTRTGLDWTEKYPSAIAAFANLNVKTAYLDSELCGVDDSGLPSFVQGGLPLVASVSPLACRRQAANVERDRRGG